MSWPRFLGIAFAIGLHGAALYSFLASNGPEPFADGNGLDNLNVAATVTIDNGDLFTQSAREASVEATAAQASPPKPEPTDEKEPEKTPGSQAKAEEQPAKQETVKDDVKPEESPKEEPEKPVEPPKKQEAPPEKTEQTDKTPEPAPKDTKPVEEPKPVTQSASVASDAQDAQQASAAEAARRTKLWAKYQSELYSAVQRAKIKPGLSKNGEVLVRITIDPSGKLNASAIVKSSGVRDLDLTALASLERAAPFPPIPREISAGPYTVTVPFQYHVK